MTTCIHILWVDDCTFIRLVAFSSVFFEYLFLLLASTFCLFHGIGEGVWGGLYLLGIEGLGIHDHSFYISLFTSKKDSGITATKITDYCIFSLSSLSLSGGFS